MVGGRVSSISVAVIEWAQANGCHKDVIEVNVSESAISDEYANLRTEIWFNARDFLAEGSIPDDEDFMEMAEPKYYYTSKGKTALESKDDIKKRLKKSPDCGDALAISFAEKHKTKQVRVRTI